MAYESHSEINIPHRVVLEERGQISISGVIEVERFDDSEIIMSTSRGTLAVRGEDLHIEKLSLDGGELKVDGQVFSLVYEDDGDVRHAGLLARLFG